MSKTRSISAAGILRLRQKCKFGRLTQAEFAFLLDVSRETVSAWETGRTVPKGPALGAIRRFEKENLRTGVAKKS